ncbi:MAG: hypothetical protein U5R49_07705 [Deltaproteobacteria bacterium]|nr:hypothetical protein [Deltaproteobacteria bacterium]
MTPPHVNQEAITLKGLILPAQWRESGDVAGLKIATFDEGEFAILNDEMGKALTHHLRQKIVVRGYFVSDDTDIEYLKVIGFRSLALEEEPLPPP